MQKKLKFILGVLSCVTVVQSPAQETSLWYDAPADEWMKSLPVGNGRVGAMVFGGVDEETVALNESSMWAGEYDPNQEKPFGREKLDELRKLFFEGKLIEGNGIAGRELVGTPHSFGTHLPIGDLKIKFDYTGKEGGVEDYRRELDLTNAVVTVSFKKGGTKYKREFISSNPQDAVVMHFTADKKQSVSFDMRMKMITAAQVRTEGNLLVFDGQALFPKLGTGGVHFQGRVVVKVDRGEVEATGETVRVKHADAVTIVADVRTDYKNGQYESLCEKTVEKAIARPFETLKEEHVADYAPLFARVSLKLADDSKKSIPVDRRWKALCEGNKDAGLQALFFQYGRYLTIASSRENSPLPIALQGFFNDNLACNMCWTSDYHLDINTEQNYWLTNVGNLAECNAPLFTYIADLAHHGAKTVRTVYGCKGWTAHTVANVWGFTAPSEGMGWGLFPLAGSWMATHLWTQYEYTLDKDYLRRTAYPLLKGNAEFLLDYMVEDPNTGYMVTGPCVSPENSFRYQGWELGASMMTTCDKVLAHEIMSACVQASDILGVDKAFADSLRLALAKFPPFRINSFGGLCEWYEDYEEAHPNHRHTSHLLSFYPYAQITKEKDPELTEAVRTTIEHRLAAEGWEDVEWSRANMVCFYARLKDAAKAEESLNILMTDFARENLLTISPEGIAGAPFDVFIFDGNAAGAAGMAEMLIQAQEGYVELLPCLPVEWKDGSFSGLCVKGGAEVSAEWKDSRVVKASLKATADNLFRLQVPAGKDYTVRLNGKKFAANLDGNRCVVAYLKKGDVIELK